MYTIYEIPGVKIGVDCKWPTRAIEQGVDPNECIILQEEGDRIQVSIDEMWWQIEKGYKVDCTPYFTIVEMNRKRASRGGIVGGKHKKSSTTRNNIKTAIVGYDYVIEQYSKNGDLIAIYDSICEAGRITKCDNIQKCITGNRKSSGGFIWKRRAI